MFQWDARALEILNTLERGRPSGGAGGGAASGTPCWAGSPTTTTQPSPPRRRRSWPPAVQSSNASPPAWPHGTVTVVHSGLPVEVTAFRKEGTYSDHRHPDRVEYTSVWRRTWPGVTSPSTPWPGTGAASLTPSADRRTWPPGGSSAAWGSRTAASRRTPCGCSGDCAWPPSWTSGWRGETAAAIRRNTPLLSYVAWGAHPGGISPSAVLSRGGADLTGLPGDGPARSSRSFTPAVGFDQKNPHHCYDVYTHSVKALGRVRPEPALRLAALLPRHRKTRLASPWTARGWATSTATRGRAPGWRSRPPPGCGWTRAPRSGWSPWWPATGFRSRPAPEWWSAAGSSGWDPTSFSTCWSWSGRTAWPAPPGPPRSPTAARKQKRWPGRFWPKKPCLTLKELAVNGRDALAAGLSGPAVGPGAEPPSGSGGGGGPAQRPVRPLPLQ